MPKSTYLANSILDYVLGNATYTPTANLYVGLFSASPTIGPDMAGTEFVIGTGGYARVSVANNLTTFPAASAGQKTIGIDIMFPLLTADQPSPAVAFGIFDAASAGHLLVFGVISPGKTCLTGDRPYFPASLGLTFQEL